MVTWVRTIQTAVLAATALTPSASAWDRQTVAASREPATALTKGVIPGRYIVELEQGSTLGQRDVKRRAADVLGDLDTLGYDVNVKEDYSSISSRFEGVSIEVSNTDEGTLNQLKNISGVADAWPVFSITLDTNFDTNNPSPKWNPHTVTRVDELHKRGFKGKGQRVCIVDSGADSFHPALVGRVAGGKNMLDDTSNIEDCNGHGTFVSSVVVGKNKDFSGVAPEAEVYMYKVFGCESSTSNDIVLKGLLAADADDCDTVSLSLGVDNGYSGSLMSQVASRIAQDRLVILAAGNAGEMGTFYASSPASGRGVVAVGSVNAKQVLGWPAMIRSSSGDSLELRYITPDGQKLNESTSVPLLFDEGDSCNPEQYGTEDQAVVVKRSVCPAAKAYNFLSSTGFGYYLIFDSYNQGVYYMSDVINSNPSVHLFALTEAHVGDWVEKEITAGRNLTLVIKADADAAASESDFAAGGQLSYFSSWGPTFENDFNPTIAAPGGAVYGAFPDNEYAIASGTSFSAPYIAGIAALFFAHSKKDASEFARRISSTAALLPSYDASEKKLVSDIAPLAQQGAGLVDAVKVMDYQTVLVSEPHISLNDTDNRVETHKIRLRNTASAQVTYRISHVAASTVQARDEYLYPYEYFPPLLSNVQGSIQGPGSVTIAPGSTEEVEITIKAPSSSNGALWSGKIVFEGSNGEFIAVPYLGVEVSTYDWTALEGSPLAFRYDSDSGYLYPVDWQERPYRPDEFSSPEIYYALRYGTYEFSLDLVGENWNKDDFAYPLSAGAGSEQWYGPLRTQPDAFGSYTEFPIKYPLRFSNVGFNTFQSFSNGTKIPSGKYKILSRALHMFGNPSSPADWQLFLSDSFRIQLGDDPIPGVTSTTAESSTEMGVSTSASLSAITDVPTTTSTSSLATFTPVPGVTKTLRATASPTGIADTFVDVSLRRQGVSSPDIYDPNSWMELHVQILIPTRLKEGSAVTFALPPQFVDVAEDDYVTDPASNLVGSASFDNNTGLYTITFAEWAEWHSDIVGDFYLYCRFSQEFQAEIEAGTYYVEIPTVGKTFYPPIHYRAVDRSKVYEHQREGITDGDAVYYFEIEVPGQLGPWKSVTFAGSQAATDDGFLCDETTVSIGTEFDDENQIVKSTDVTAASVQRCEVKAFKAVYSGEIPTDEVLRFSVANILGFKASWTITLSYSLAIELTNGSTIGYELRTLSFERYARSSPEAWAHSGWYHYINLLSLVDNRLLVKHLDSFRKCYNSASFVDGSLYDCLGHNLPHFIDELIHELNFRSFHTVHLHYHNSFVFIPGPLHLFCDSSFVFVSEPLGRFYSSFFLVPRPIHPYYFNYYFTLELYNIHPLGDFIRYFRARESQLNHSFWKAQYHDQPADEDNGQS
ncbi:hypothetical protein QQZ08_004370 [Neonectria magnoliae]|uniref:Uncharacterized protein n=1 Tax=Neonectria magnoliae TaxID=2732573 RepID=A0ABR1I835_9HYPO